MEKVQIVRGDALPFQSTRDIVSAERRAALPEAELNTDARTYFPGSSHDPQLFEVDLPPFTLIAPHAHEVDQIMYVVAGSLAFGNQVCPAGSAAFIKGRTLYGFAVGAEGARFLNFRPTADRSHILQHEFLAQRDSGSTAPTGDATA